MKSKSPNIFKRLSAAMIDCFCIIVTLYLLTVIVTDPIANGVFHIDSLSEQATEIKHDYAVHYDLGYTIENSVTNEEEFEYYSSKSLYEDAKLADYMKENNLSDIDENLEITLRVQYGSKYETALVEFENALKLDEEYNRLSSSINSADYLAFIFSSFIAEFLFMFLIPFVLFKGQTLGCRVNDLICISKEDIYCNKYQGLAYFATIYFVETALVYSFFGIDIVIIVPVVNILCWAITRHRQTLHNVLSKTKVVDLTTAAIYTTIEERDHTRELEAKTN